MKENSPFTSNMSKSGGSHLKAKLSLNRPIMIQIEDTENNEGNFNIKKPSLMPLFGAKLSSMHDSLSDDD